MKLFAFAALSISALGTVCGLTAEKPVAPGCNDNHVLKLVRQSIAASPAAQQMNVAIDNISDETGTKLDEQWHCVARLQTDKGLFPVQYLVRLNGPIEIQIDVTASFSEAARS